MTWHGSAEASDCVSCCNAQLDNWLVGGCQSAFDNIADSHYTRAKLMAVLKASFAQGRKFIKRVVTTLKCQTMRLLLFDIHISKIRDGWSFLFVCAMFCF